MACATLKRSLDWEPVLARPAKRRRCIPFCNSPTQRDRASPPISPPLVAPMMMASSPSTSAAASSSSSSSLSSSKTKRSAFPEVVGQKLTPEYMAESIKAELKRLQRRKQLQFSSECGDASSSTGENSSDSSSRALFTFKQVGLICERMLRELESDIREEYDNVLSQKLAEQYEDFVRFTFDQIERNYSTSHPSYLS